jgi:ATP-dependent Clp protease ATP-binding subunit ClpC
MTSNVGARDLTKTKSLGFTSGDAAANWERRAEKVRDELKNVFNPEFLNRLDDVIVFHPLDRGHIALIVSILLKDVRKRLAEEELTMKLSDAATEFLVKHGYDEQYGARPLKRSIQKYIEDPLSEKILMGEFTRGDEIEVELATEGDRLDFKVLSSTTTPQA